jgi:hypothetical protein
MRGGAIKKCNVAASKCEGRKETALFGHVPVSHAPPIFISEAMSLTNIGHVYSSVTWLHRGIYGAGQSQTRRPIYSLVPELNRRI